MQCSVTHLLVILVLSSCCCCGWSFASSTGRCGYRQVQQMFDWAKHGPNGCINLKSLKFIFGEGEDKSPKLTAARFLTANLVFTGTVTHVVKDLSVHQGTAYKITVRVHCYLKGRLSSSEIVITGFPIDPATGLCLSVNCQDGDTGLFFTTYLSPDDIRINENGFVKEGADFDSALQVLRCRENYGEVNFWSANGQAAEYCTRMEQQNEPTCQMSLNTARVYLDHAFINFESDLKPECLEGKDFVMKQLFLPPVGASPALSMLSSEGSAATRHGPSAGATVLLLIVAQQLVARCVLM